MNMAFAPHAILLISKRTRLAAVLLVTVAPVAIAQAGEINIPAGTLGAALDAYSGYDRQPGSQSSQTTPH